MKRTGASHSISVYGRVVAPRAKPEPPAEKIYSLPNRHATGNKRVQLQLYNIPSPVRPSSVRACAAGGEKYRFLGDGIESERSKNQARRMRRWLQDPLRFSLNV